MRFPLHRVKKAYRSFVYPTAQIVNPSFEGWGMASCLAPPLCFEGSRDSHFSLDTIHLRKRIEEGKFILSQFASLNPGKVLDELQWRHYIVQLSIQRAFYNSLILGNRLHCDEFGVCDGLTAFYAIRALLRLASAASFGLWDAWGAMREADLMPDEAHWAGSYAHLNLSTTKQNLSEYKAYLSFHPGFLPGTLPDVIESGLSRWLHIDLNNARLTQLILERYFLISSPGSIALLDDYGHNGFESTRLAVDTFLHSNQHEVSLEVMPTGQAILQRVSAPDRVRA